MTGPTTDEFRQAMGRFVTGVTVVTTLADGIDHAMTANALASVSLEPMLVVLGVEQEARWHDAVLTAGVWGVSILGEPDRATAQWLATRGRPLHDQLARVPVVRGPRTGVALLEGALATLECRTQQVVPAGDHSVLLAEVLHVGLPDHTPDALTFYRGRFGHLS